MNISELLKLLKLAGGLRTPRTWVTMFRAPDDARRQGWRSISNGIQLTSKMCPGWWFQTCFIFHNVWDNPSHWLIFVKMVKTTNQTCCHRLGILGGLPDELQVKRVRWLSRTGRRTPGSTCCIVRITGFGSYGGLRVELPHSWFD
jgi:hypothetical protein